MFVCFATNIVVFITVPGYAGCFSEDPELILPEHEKIDQKMTIVKCLDHCRSKGPDYFYAGITRGAYCRCGTLDAFAAHVHKKVSNDECSAPCGGENDLNCGGSGTISIYTGNIKHKLID